MSANSMPRRRRTAFQRALRTACALALACSLALLGACSSTNKYKQPYDELVEASRAYDAEAYAQAVDTCEELLATTADDQQDFAVQRGYAQYLLVKAHAAASAGAPFLREPRPALIVLGGQEARDVPSETAHMVACVTFAGTAVAWLSALREAPAAIDGQPLLPDALRAIAPARAVDSLRLACLTQYARLGFETKVGESLAANTRLLKLGSCDDALAELDVPRPLRPWIYWAVYRHLSGLPSRDVQGDAFQFAMRFLHGESDSRQAAPELVQQLEDWIRDNSHCTFCCPKCGRQYVSGRRTCLDDATPVVEFIPHWK